MRQAHVWLLAVALFSGITGCEASPPEVIRVPSLHGITLDPALFGPEWRRAPGLVIERREDWQHVPEEYRDMASILANQMESKGVVAMADYSCARTRGKLNIVTVRVFRFKNEILAKQWRAEKYEFPGWKEYYRVVDGADGWAVDSLELSKRIVMRGRWWITSHHLGEDDLHLRALRAIMFQLELDGG
ncbi:MAG: hypothetical protein R3336_07220 [Phycisphaeraceae bacterium]|nr:hypothetical protein [Phycisphaeraceae bacterium]